GLWPPMTISTIASRAAASRRNIASFFIVRVDYSPSRTNRALVPLYIRAMSLPTTRVLAVLELLQSQTQIGGAELASRVGVDRRTLRRYIATLEEMGIPITTEQGRYGGYKLVPGFKLPPMMFTDEEAQALSLGLIAARGLGLADAAPAIASVQAKLDRVLPSAPKR